MVRRIVCKFRHEKAGKLERSILTEVKIEPIEGRDAIFVVPASPWHSGQTDSPVLRLFARVFTAPDIDSVKRELGMVKDCSRSAAPYRDEILALHAEGVGVCAIARRLGLGRKSVTRVVRRAAQSKTPSK